MIKKKVLGTIIWQGSADFIASMYNFKTSPSYNVQECFWNFCYHVVASYFKWPFSYSVISLF